jgi:ribonuclease P protein subunit RPR2
MPKTKPKKPRKHRYQKKPQSTVKLAKEHITKLFTQAKQVAKENPSLANRYVTLARKTAMKFKIRLPSEQKRLFCPHCYRFLQPGRNLRTRIHEHRIIYSCLDCKKFWRKPLK